MKAFAKLAVATLVILFTLVLVFGCASTKRVDWNTRVGTYTFDQAITELGPPDRQAQTSDGSNVAEWITGRTGRSSFTVGTGFSSSSSGFSGTRTGVGVSKTTGGGYDERVLQLTFGTNGVLTAWQNR